MGKGQQRWATRKSSSTKVWLKGRGEVQLCF